MDQRHETKDRPEDAASPTDVVDAFDDRNRVWDIEAASRVYVGRWNRLVSETNWEKGRVILEWREAMVDSGADPTAYSDEAWATRVGGVSSQHVGRLRRVHQRFGNVHREYEGLYWSHFFAASEWNDAEMWLEGALRNGWSIARMRDMRSEALGLITESPNAAEQELDEDFESDGDRSFGAIEIVDGPSSSGDRIDSADGRAGEEDADADRSAQARSAIEDAGDEWAERVDGGDLDGPDASNGARFQPFADLPEVPDDVADALEVFKLAILTHRAARWKSISPDDVVRCLDALRRLALAPLD